MNRKQLGIVLALLVIVGGLGLVVYRHNAKTWHGAAAPKGERVLAPFDLNAVARITLTGATGSATLEKREGEWIVAERGYAADFSQIRDLIRKLWELKPLQQMKADASQYARLELKAPKSDDPEGSALQVVLSDESGKELATVFLGKIFMKKSPQFPDSEGFPSGRYVMSGHREGEVALVEEAFTSVKASPEVWLDKTFLDLSKIEAVELKGATPELTWKMERKENEWHSPGLKEGEKLGVSKVPNFDSTLGHLSFTDVEPADAKAPEIIHRVEVRTDDHFDYTFGLAELKGDRQPVTVTVSAEFPKERTPEKDEKPEDKQRLDEAFAAKHKELEARLEREKKLEGRVFLVSSGTFSPMLSPLSEFVEAPPAPEPSPEASPSGETTPPEATPDEG
ncbi:MAG TPA: DUF4340 domain-containing protein [Chthoniobacteraceae bacterium]|nr:DUF4340 domain-containing protein [Chthoniobacteraceae bacterium]